MRPPSAKKMYLLLLLAAWIRTDKELGLISELGDMSIGSGTFEWDF